MKKNQTLLIGILAILFISAAVIIFMSGNPQVKDGGDLHGSSGKHYMKDGDYFVYGFDKDPKMGTVILKIQVFDDKVIKDSSYDIYGYLSMTAMPEMNGGSDKKFLLNKKGDYLCPFDITMPGEWGMKLKFIKGGKQIHEESLKFNI